MYARIRVTSRRDQRVSAESGGPSGTGRESGRQVLNACSASASVPRQARRSALPEAAVCFSTSYEIHQRSGHGGTAIANRSTRGGVTPDHVAPLVTTEPATRNRDA